MDRTEPVELAVSVMVTDKDGRILVLDKQDESWGGIYFPGGHVERGESFVHAAIREVREETGLEIRHPVLCGTKQFPSKHGRYLVVFYKTSSFSGTLQDSPEGPVFWLHPRDLSNCRLTDHFIETVALCNDPEQSEMYWYTHDDHWSFDIL